MNLFVDEPERSVRSGADWEHHRRHRSPQSGPPQDEVGALVLSSFLLVRSQEVVVAVRGGTAYSDGLHLEVVVLFADEQRGEDLAAGPTAGSPRPSSRSTRRRCSRRLPAPPRSGESPRAS